MAEVFVDLDGKVVRYNNMSDEHEFIKIAEKQVKIGNIGLIVHGDDNSQMLMFEINRFYDSVDLKDKTIKFIYKNKNGVFVDEAVNIAYSDSLLRFSWVIPYGVTLSAGTVLACIQFVGKDENNNNYSLKTTNFTLKIEDSLDGTDMDAADINWFEDVECRLSGLEKDIATSIAPFVGTQSEFEAALAAGEIVDGQIIYITD